MRAAVVWSHPSRVRGLKYEGELRNDTLKRVAPFTGAWVEIEEWWLMTVPEQVAPFTGAWVEIRTRRCSIWSRVVAPFTGAWVEI